MAQDPIRALAAARRAQPQPTDVDRDFVDSVHQACADHLAKSNNQRSPQVTDMARRMLGDAAQMRAMIHAAHRTRRVINGGPQGPIDVGMAASPQIP